MSDTVVMDEHQALEHAKDLAIAQLAMRFNEPRAAYDIKRKALTLPSVTSTDLLVVIDYLAEFAAGLAHLAASEAEATSTTAKVSQTDELEELFGVPSDETNQLFLLRPSARRAMGYIEHKTRALHARIDTL